MSTSRFTSAANRGSERSGRWRAARYCAALGLTVLCLLTVLLPPAAFAAGTRPASRSSASLSGTGILEQAGVSVVRLVITYSMTKNTQVSCTALGTLIDSWPAASATEQNNWVVTDGSFLSRTGGACSKGSSLSQIQILANHLYTNTPDTASSSLTLLDTLQCTNGTCRDQQGSSAPVTESLSSTPAGGGVLFSFHTATLDMQPFLDAATGSSASSVGIELASQSQAVQWPIVPQIVATQAQTFLTPVNPPSAPASASGGTPTSKATPAAASRFEPGMPYVDTQGHFVEMQVAGTSTLFTVTNLRALEQPFPELQQPHATNTLKQQWDAGIQDFFAGNYSKAQQELNVIQDPTKVNNPNFQAAKSFAQQAAAKAPTSAGGTPTTSGSTPGSSGSFLGLSTSSILIIGLVAGLVFLILLLVLVSLLFGRRRALHKKEREELVRFKEDEAAARRNAPLEARRIAEESQRRAQPYDAVAPEPPPAAVPTAPPVPPAPVVPPAPSALTAPLPPQPQADYQEADALDAPTVPMNGRNGRSNSDTLTTDRPVVRELRNVSLAVGSVTNVGLKRQHKPNEDSSFAFQATKTYNSQPMQFGLFIIADGMGGHASGQDASRTAIQTMIDFMLPRISVAGGPVSDQDYLKLLEEGVQRANYAVHQRNIQDHADSGTTMTTALVIGSMAYIANVGDSRTYLYRQSTGLTKVTRDHSVVASLVDAGIIQPDDIYTHPKRNQIYRSLGEKPVVEVDSFPVELQPGDKLLLCSDGLWDMVRDPEIQRIIAEAEPDPNKTGQELIQAALKGGGEDNVSVIVVSISEVAGHTGMTGIQFLAKPETVTVPDLPAM